MGVLQTDGASKGFLTTTSDFAPKIPTDPLIVPSFLSDLSSSTERCSLGGFKNLQKSGRTAVEETSVFKVPVVFVSLRGRRRDWILLFLNANPEKSHVDLFYFFSFLLFFLQPRCVLLLNVLCDDLARDDVELKGAGVF
jgi:hypothetical protein